MHSSDGFLRPDSATFQASSLCRTCCLEGSANFERSVDFQGKPKAVVGTPL
jgi:hypothetical protein